MTRRLFPLLLLPLAILMGCKDEINTRTLPTPIELTDEAAGHYCQMVIMEHQGPKAQIHLAGYPAPIWFSQVRDGIAYVKSPEQSDEILVLYVNDMGAAESWTKPGANNWINAETAYFVVGSSAIGGMGAPEVAPFGTLEQAQTFADEKGGEVMQLADIPIEAVLSAIEFTTDNSEN